ncbi:MAG: phage major capsid protein, partial [Gallionella sp.]|nr:phage major capsid protein [Gallionella sp.]
MFTRKNLTFGLLVLVAIAAVFAIAGHPVISPDVLAGLGFIPVVTGETSFSDVKTILENQGRDFQAWKAKQDEKYSELSKNMDELGMKANRPNMGGSGGASSEIKHLRTADGKSVPLLRSEQKFADLYRGEKSEFNIGEFCRDAVCGSTKAASGAALVPVAVGSQIIDMVREATVISLAGAGTIAIDGPTNLARLTSGPTVYQHTEGATDIVESDIVAAPVTLNPKTLAVLVPLTVELVQDSPNLNALLTSALA